MQRHAARLQELQEAAHAQEQACASAVVMPGWPTSTIPRPHESRDPTRTPAAPQALQDLSKAFAAGHEPKAATATATATAAAAAEEEDECGEEDDETAEETARAELQRVLQQPQWRM